MEELEKLDPNTKAIFIKLFKEIERAIGEVVTRRDLMELTKEIEALTKAVHELTEAQKKSEERISRLEQAVHELTEAQKRSEERISRLEQAVHELTEAQKKSEERISRLEQAVHELTEAQKKSEERISRLEQAVHELTEAQKQINERIRELAEAQKRTEETLTKLIEEHKKTREQLGGLSHTVGYILEDRAYKHLPKLLKEDFGIEVEGSLRRDYIQISPNRYEEINIIGKGRVNGREVVILGEAKTQLKKTDIDNFMVKINKINPALGYKEKILLFVTYQTPPPVREYAKEKGVAIYFSYQFE